MSRKILNYICAFALAGAGCNSATEEKAPAHAAPDYSSLHAVADSLAKATPSNIAFALVNIETGDTFSHNGDAHMPTQSTIKFPLALMVLNEVDNGRLSLDSIIHISKKELPEYTYSPMRDSMGNKPGTQSIHDMLVFMTTVSDNISCYIFTRMMGGYTGVETYIKSQGVQGIHLTGNADDPIIDFSRPYENWITPKDMAVLMVKFYKGKVVSRASTDTLRQIMERTTGGAGRIKGLLPAGTVVAHKTGSSGTENGFTVAVNDIGIITLPNGNHLALAVYVSDVQGDMAAGEAIIANIARKLYDIATEQ